MSYVVHCTKKLLERIKPPTIAAGGALGMVDVNYPDRSATTILAVGSGE